jgi:potassium voltage-gated channel subfamily G protein 2
LAVLPYFISALVESLEDLQILGKAGKIMRLVRVMRILRIFKLVRHFAGLQSLLYTLKQAYKELGLLIILVINPFLLQGILNYMDVSTW